MDEIEVENRRLKAIIVKYLPTDQVCMLCEHFEQCKKEAEDEADYHVQENTRFWTCYDGQHFILKKEKSNDK